MAVKDKIFYWLKLKTEFMTGDVIDFLMSQKNGANYVVLYEMLCIKTINTKGELATQIGEVLVPFDIDKIQRECKWFDRDTIIVAMELYKKLGLLYIQESGIIKIANFDEIVGNETYWAKQKRLSNSKNGEEKENIGNELEKVQQPLISNISNSKSLVEEVVNYLNKVCNTSYRTTTAKTQSLINARIREKFTLDDFKLVIDYKYKEWGNDDKMKQYLRPETLFGTKFEGYLQGAKSTGGNDTEFKPDGLYAEVYNLTKV